MCYNCCTKIWWKCRCIIRISISTYFLRKDFSPLCSIVTMVCRLSVTALEIPFTMQKKINENFFLMEILIRFPFALVKKGFDDARSTKKWPQCKNYYLPYARHYNPRFVYFLPHFYIEVRFILQTTLWTKNGNSSFLKPKIRGLYSRAVSDRERVIMARVRYIIFFITVVVTSKC